MPVPPIFILRDLGLSASCVGKPARKIELDRIYAAIDHLILSALPALGPDGSEKRHRAAACLLDHELQSLLDLECLWVIDTDDIADHSRTFFEFHDRYRVGQAEWALYAERAMIDHPANQAGGASRVFPTERGIKALRAFFARGQECVAATGTPHES
jgi:hypothetical protein